MADPGLQERIIKLLNGKPKKSETAAKIIQTLRVPKKSLNIQLYKLESEGRVTRAQESPPVWALSQGDLRETRSKRKTGTTVQHQQEDEQLEQKILEFLRNKQKPSKSLEIAKAAGKTRASDVNTTLYKLQETGLIQKLSEKPPTWAIAAGNDKIDATSPSHGAAKIEPYSDQASSTSFHSEDQGIPIFQETELFKTELTFDSEFDPSDAFAAAADGYDSEEDENDDDDSEENDFELNQHLEKQEAPEESTVCSTSSESPINRHNLGESSETSSPKNEQELENNMDISDIRPNSAGDNIELIDKLTENPDEFVDMETENEREKCQLNHDVPDFDRDYVKKPRTFRDVFKLDQAMSDDTSSFDSAKELDVEYKMEVNSCDTKSINNLEECQSGKNSPVEGRERKSTPEVPSIAKEIETPEQKNTLRQWDTPEILNQVLDLQEDVSPGCINNKDESHDINTLNKELDVPGTDESEINAGYKTKELEDAPAENFLSQSETLTVKDEINQVEMDSDSSGKPTNDDAGSADRAASTVKMEDSDMEDCDKVLKVLQELKGIAQFVLKRKTNIPPENLDSILQKCASMNYVSGSAKLWKITDEGMEYISTKTGEGNTVDESVTVNSIPPEKKMKPMFKGPPPPPLTLLGKTRTSLDGNKSVSDRESQQTSRSLSSSQTVHSASSLFKPSSSIVSNVSKSSLFSPSVSKSVSSAEGSSGPKPLMSLQLDVNSTNKSKFSVPLSREGDVKPLMSIQFESNPLNKAKSLLPQHYDQMQIDQEANKANHYNADSQMLNTNLWGTGAITTASNSSSVMGMSRVSSVSKSSGQFFESSAQSSSLGDTVRSPNLSNVGQRLTPKQNTRVTAAIPEKQIREIPSKYADYPNQTASMQSLKSKTNSKPGSQSAPNSQSKSAFNRGPPPSPFDILSKSMKKTEISPPSSFKDKITVSHPSESFSTLSQTARNTSSLNSSAERKSVFSSGQFAPASSGQFAQTGAHIYSSGAAERNQPDKRVNQSSFTQPLYGNQSIQSGSKTLFSSAKLGTTANQPVTGFRGPTSRASSGGPPPPPAVKLGLQSRQSTVAPVVATPAQTDKPNLGLALSNESFNALNKNPVSALMEYAQSRKLVARVEVLNRRGSSHKPSFEMAAFVGNHKFPSVTCHNKKDGRKEACDIALRQLVAEGQFKAEATATSNIPAVPAANMTHFDTIAALTHRGFTALVSQITAESFAGRKVIAGLVMKRSPNDTGVLVSLGTGNRCITGQQMSLQGNTVNDSHAEIITRRGFLRFLYKQLLEFNPGRPHPMFEKSPSGKLKIRPNITFHLYISTAPCGDGALFSPRDSESNKSAIDTRVRPPHEPTFSSNVQGLLRTKVEGGEGTIPIESGFRGQTFDGIQRGERLRTMSCTDKVCRWNVVGMQGALLSHFLDPVYLDSLTLGLLYDHGHLSRAVCCRVGRGSVDVNTELPPGYRLNHPWLGRVTVCDPPREVQKTKALSVNWSFGDKGPEVTDGTQGLCYTSIEKGFFSRCSKRNLFTSFKALCEKFGRQDLLQMSSYNEAKVAVQDFVTAKKVMLRRFKENGFGKWVSKPVEEEMFSFDEHK